MPKGIAYTDGVPDYIRTLNPTKAITMKKPKVNKFLYGWKLYVNYGSGWEYEQFESSFKDMKSCRQAYRENCFYPQKWRRGRETNPEYTEKVTR